MGYLALGLGADAQMFTDLAGLADHRLELGILDRGGPGQFDRRGALGIGDQLFGRPFGTSGTAVPGGFRSGLGWAVHGVAGVRRVLRHGHHPASVSFPLRPTGFSRRFGAG